MIEISFEVASSDEMHYLSLMFGSPKGFSFTLNTAFFVNRCNFKIIDAIFLFTFYIINQVSIFNFHIIWQVLPICLN